MVSAAGESRVAPEAYFARFEKWGAD